MDDRRVAAGLEAMLWMPVLRAAFAGSPLGDYGASEVATALVRSGADGFAATLTAQLEPRR